MGRSLDVLVHGAQEVDVDPLLLAQAANADIVAGYRKHRRDPLLRRLNAWAFFTLVRLLFGRLVRDVNCAFRLTRRGALAAGLGGAAVGMAVGGPPGALIGGVVGAAGGAIAGEAAEGDDDEAGAGAGGAAGAMTGAVVGGAVAGPPGALVGGAIGAAGGAAAGDRAEEGVKDEVAGSETAPRDATTNPDRSY